MKIIKNGSTVIVITDNGEVLHKNECTDETFEKIKNTTDNNHLLALMLNGYETIIQKRIEVEEYINSVEGSKLLKKKNDSIYWEGVSELSMPETFVKAVLDAEKQENKDRLEAYKNFWVLMSLNPDPECRKNLYWFLEKWGMKIAKCGMFIGYRNVDIKQQGFTTTYSQELCDFVTSNYERLKNQKKSTSSWLVVDRGEGNISLEKTVSQDDFTSSSHFKIYNLKDLYAELKAVNFLASNVGNDTIYTDHYSHSFTIKVGELVSMPREETDSDSEVCCSRGLMCSPIHL